MSSNVSSKGRYLRAVVFCLAFPFVLWHVSFRFFWDEFAVKNKKTNRWFSCFFAEVAFLDNSKSPLSSNFGLLTANNDKFFAFYLLSKHLFRLHSSLLFFLLKHSRVIKHSFVLCHSTLLKREQTESQRTSLQFLYPLRKKGLNVRKL